MIRNIIAFVFDKFPQQLFFLMQARNHQTCRSKSRRDRYANANMCVLPCRLWRHGAFSLYTEKDGHLPSLRNIELKKAIQAMVHLQGFEPGTH